MRREGRVGREGSKNSRRRNICDIEDGGKRGGREGGWGVSE